MLKKTLIIALLMALFAASSYGQHTVTYPSANLSLTNGTAITGSIVPNVTGGPYTFTTIPELHPATGLDISSATGIITGIPNKVITQAFKINATASDGQVVSFTLNIDIKNPPPPVVSYPSSNNYTVNSPVEIKPAASGTPVDHYSLEPGSTPLPAVFSLNAATGYITGTPTAAIATGTYAIRATSAGGLVNTVSNVTITVTDPLAPGINYNTPNALTYGTSATIAPSVSGGTFTNYSIDPDIHANTGLNFDTHTGIIRGIPSIISGNVNYHVMATVAANDFRYTNLMVKVDPALTTNLYPASVGHFFIDSLVSMKPGKDADTLNTVYSIQPKLPRGLEINPKTGEIRGFPDSVTAGKTYTVTGVYGGYPTRYPIYFDIAKYSDYVSKPATISFVGQGNIQQSLNSKSSLAANTGIGVVFRQNSSRRYGILHDIEIDFFINVASTVDTIKSVNMIDPTDAAKKANIVTNKTDFGNSVLLPLNSGQAFSFSFKGFFSERGGKPQADGSGGGNYMRNDAPRSLAGFLSGFYISASGSNRNWEYDEIAVDPTTQVKTTTATAVKTSLLSLYAGPFFEFITPKKSNNYGQNSSITLGVGYSARLILGDAQQGSNTDFRKKLLGPNSASSYMGPEVMLGLRFYNIKAEVHIPMFSNAHEAPGLSGTHLTTFIGFSGGFPLDLTKPAQ